MRGAWIEIIIPPTVAGAVTASHLVRGAWIEIHRRALLDSAVWSHLVRGAWIEIITDTRALISDIVAPRERCVD